LVAVARRVLVLLLVAMGAHRLLVTCLLQAVVVAAITKVSQVRLAVLVVVAVLVTALAALEQLVKVITVAQEVLTSTTQTLVVAGAEVVRQLLVTTT
jgi:TM2 domain-containing membrane protein YozV